MATAAPLVSDTDSGVRNMTVTRCTFDGTDIGVRLKSRRGRGGLVENITYSDLTMKNVGQAIVISSYYYNLSKTRHSRRGFARRCKTPPYGITSSFGTSWPRGGTKDAGLIIGLPEMPARDIEIENVSIASKAGLRIAYADGVTLRNVRVSPEAGDSPIMVEDTVRNLAQ